MSKFQLYIGGEKVDQYKDESVNLTETIQDIRDISKVFTDYSKPFTLPASDVNNKIFKHYYRFNLGHGYAFDARKKVDAKLELNTIPYRDGKIVLEGVDLENGRPKSYRITFFGNTVNLKDVLGEDEINSLTWLSNFNTTYSEAEVENTLISSTGKTFTVDTVQYEAALIVPLISNSARLYYDSTIEVPYENADGSENYELGGNLYPTNQGSEGTDDVHGVYFEDLTYAVRLHLIVKAIEEQYEDIVFSDDFLDLTNGPDVYKNLYMLCQRTAGRPFEDMGVGEKLITGFPTTVNNYIAVSNEAVRVYNLNPNQLVTGSWTINTQQAYPDFTAVLKEGSEEIFRKDFAAGTNTTATISQVLTNSSEGYTLTIETQTAFTIQSVSFQGTTPTGNQLTSQITTQIAVTNEKEFVVQNHLPNLKIIDFLTGLFKMFNLTAFVKDGIIHVKTLDSFYQSGTIRDITEFIDPQSMQVDKALPYEEIEFKYRDTESKIAKQHEQLSSNAWGAIKYQETGDLNSSESKFDVVAPFAHLKYERLANTDIQWGWMANENGESYFKDAVLFIGNYVSLPTSSYLRFLTGKSGVSSISDIQDYWMPSNTVDRDPTVSTESLHFNLELSEWTNSSAFTSTLFDQYYREYIAGIFNSAKRLTKVRARLPKKFVINYTLADTLLINGEKYKINSITTNLMTGESQLELLNDTVVDAAISQTDTGGGEGQTGSPLTNVLTLYQCDSPNATFESTTTLATLNLAVNTRVEDTSGNTYRVTGNNVPNTHTSVAVSSTGLTGCPSTPTTPTTTYYGLTRCSDNEQNLRTSTEVGNPTYAITQQVFDSGSVKYIVRNSSALAPVPSITIASTPSPVQLTCAGNTTTNYYQLNPCCSGTTYFGFSANSSLSGTVIYQGQSYVISPTSTSGTIDIDSLSTGSCQTYYYTLNDCSNTSSIVHYANSNCSNLAGTELEYSGTCYYVATTTNTSGTIDLDNLSSCSCGGGPVTPPATEYYVLRDCDTATLVVTTTTTNDLTLTVSTTPSSASRVQDSSTGKCYTANALTTNPSQYATQIGQVSDLSVLGCPSTPCTSVLYYHLQQCSTNNTGYISGQTTTQISLSTNDMVATGSTSGPRYKVIGTTSSGSSVGTVYAVSDTDCPTFYELQQCYTLQGSYRTDQNVNEITLNVGDRVADSCGMPYTVVTVGVSGGGYANVGTVTDLGASGCPTASGPYYSLQKCSDSTTGYTSLQQTSDITIAINDTVTVAGTRYQVVGTTSSASNQVGVVCPDGGNNCITPVTPPPQPPATIYYARFISCDDPTGAVIAVFSYSQIGTWWVISEVGQFECYRWLDNVQGANPVELNSSNFNFFTEESTAGGNCLDCQAQSPPPPPPPPPPAQTCFSLTLYRATTAIDLCSATQRTVYTNGASLGASTTIYSTSDCSALLGTDQYLSDDGGNTYYFWNSSAQTLTGPFTNNCP